MKHWRVEQIDWGRFDPALVDADTIPLVKAAAMVERNGDDYARHLARIFHDDPDFRAAAVNWGIEEVQHGDALGRWGELADPGWNYASAFARYRDGYQIPMAPDGSVRGSRSGELIARCMVETGTSSYYTAVGEASAEPVLREICRLIAADEYRHFKLFYDHLRRYLTREELHFFRRLRIAAGRVGETEDDELAFAFHCANAPVGQAYDHAGSLAAYMVRAMKFYRYHHIERAMGMTFKAVGLTPRGRLADLAARGAWRLLQWRRDRFEAALATAAA